MSIAIVNDSLTSETPTQFIALYHQPNLIYILRFETNKYLYILYLNLKQQSVHIRSTLDLNMEFQQHGQTQSTQPIEMAQDVDTEETTDRGSGSGNKSKKVVKVAFKVVKKVVKGAASVALEE